MSVSDIWGDMLDALADPYRRQLLVALTEHNPRGDDDRDPLGLLSASEKQTVNDADLVHNHLPKLEQHGFIEWDREANTVSKGPRFDDIEPVITLIHEHRDGLPDGWL